MPPPTTATPSGPTSRRDEIDDLFDYDAGGVDDVFGDNYQHTASKDKSTASTSNAKSSENLGIDEEVEVTRKPRAPRVKLDEHRLLSAAGIPKLRTKAKSHLKFKGKGHEYSDASRLLSFYQLWLDDLFPKARFLDALAMVEKAGHKKMVQSARMEWINEGRPRSSVHEDSIFDEPAPTRRDSKERESTAVRIAPIFEKTSTERLNTPPGNLNGVEDDLYDATPRASIIRPSTGVDSQDSIFGGGESLFGKAKVAIDDVPDDELDALFAEDESVQAATGEGHPVVAPGKVTGVEEDFDDEMEALADMEGMW